MVIADPHMQSAANSPSNSAHGDVIGETVISSDQLAQRIAQLGAAISNDYQGRNPLLVCVLKGAFMFLTDLMREITVPCEVDFMSVASYGSATRSSGVVRILKDLDEAIEGRDVLIVEDIVDSGLTLGYLTRTLGARNPGSLEVCTLLAKPQSESAQQPLRYVGFQIPDCFVIGYGLDYAQQYRNLPHIALLNGPERA
jgi:hypoxanthine phosphoribosyltransferase